MDAYFPSLWLIESETLIWNGKKVKSCHSIKYEIQIYIEATLHLYSGGRETIRHGTKDNIWVGDIGNRHKRARVIKQFRTRTWLLNCQSRCELGVGVQQWDGLVAKKYQDIYTGAKVQGWYCTVTRALGCAVSSKNTQWPSHGGFMRWLQIRTACHYLIKQTIGDTLWQVCTGGLMAIWQIFFRWIFTHVATLRKKSIFHLVHETHPSFSLSRQRCASVIKGGEKRPISHLTRGKEHHMIWKQIFTRSAYKNSINSFC